MSINVTYNSSPGLGGSTCPCCLAGVEDKARTIAGRGNGSEVRDAIENAIALCGREGVARYEALRGIGARDLVRERKRALGVAITIYREDGQTRGNEAVGMEVEEA